MNRKEFDRQIKTAARAIESFEQQLAGSLAEELRLMDNEQRISRELGLKSHVDIHRKRRLEALYRILSFGTVKQRAVIFIGTDDEINSAIETVVRDGGFFNATGYFVELPS